jgi:hypothetical protein
MSAPMDAARSASYRRGVGSRRHSLLAVLVTAVAGCALAAGGYVYGKRADGDPVPASVPVQTVPKPAGVDPIVIPSRVDLPSR